MEDAAEFLKLSNEPVIADLRRSERNLNKIPTDFKPMLSFSTNKKKRTITYFLKTNPTSNTTSKKRKVNPFNDIYFQYKFDLNIFRLPR